MYESDRNCTHLCVRERRERKKERQAQNNNKVEKGVKVVIEYGENIETPSIPFGSY